ncbi:MAG: DMT family transporter [Candidatus Neomarinimicrobiota bacterium]
MPAPFGDSHPVPITKVPNPFIQWLVFWCLAGAWGCSFLFIKIGVTYIGPLTLVSGRFLIGLVGTLLLVSNRRAVLPGSLRRWGQLLFLGTFNLALPIFLISWGEQSIDSSMAAVLNATVPIWAVSIAHFALPDERLTAAKVAGIAIGFIGVVVLVGLPAAAQSSFWGQLAVVVAAVSYAFGSIYVRRYLRGVPHNQIIVVTLISALLITGTATLIVEGLPTAGVHPNALMAMLWLGLVATALSYKLYYRLLDWWGAGRSTTVTYVFPVVGVILGIIFLDEGLTIRFILGGMLILLGVTTANRKPA